MQDCISYLKVTVHWEFGSIRLFVLNKSIYHL